MEAVLDGLSMGFTWLLRSSWQGALLVVVILAVQGAFRGRLSAQWRHALWGLLVLRLLLVWAPPAPWSVYNFAAPVALREIPAAVSSVEVPPIIEVVAFTPPVSMAVREGAASPVGRDGRDLSDGRDRAIALSAREVVALIWLGITVLFLGVMGYQTLRFGRHVRSGQLVTDSVAMELLEQCRSRLRVGTYLALVETDCVRSPALLGCIRPKLLVPRGFLETLSRDEMRHIFLHELAHVKRGDIWSSWLINLLTAAHWFNPLIWYARRRFIADREAACDAHVLTALDESGQRAYGHTVLNLMQRFNATGWAPGIAGISENNSNLKRRILMIKHFRAPSRWTAWVGTGLCVCIGLATLTNAQQLSGQLAELVCEPSDIFAYTDPNGDTLIAVQLTNTADNPLVIEVEFWEGAPNTGRKLGRGNLEIPGGKTATQAVSWAVLNGRHPVSVWIDPENTVAEVDEDNNLVETVINFKDGRFTRESPEVMTGGSAPTVSGKELWAIALAIAKRQGTVVPQLENVGEIEMKIILAPEPHLTPKERDIVASYISIIESMAKGTHETTTPGRSLGGPGAPRRATGPQPGEAEVSPAELRAQCQDNLKQLGLRFKMFANDTRSEYFPLLSQEPGRLMFEWGGDVPTLHGADILSSRYPGDIPAFCVCPSTGNSAEIPDDTDYVYLGYVTRDDADVADFAEAYGKHLTEDGAVGVHFADNLPSTRHPDRGILRLREGVERFFITDINNPAGPALEQSKIPTMIEWPDLNPATGGVLGGNVLYMDGHAEFLTYPGKWPMTERTISILCELAGREPIKAVEN